LPEDLVLQWVTEYGVFINDKRAYAVVRIDDNGRSKCFQLAAHVDKQPVVLLATTGTSVEAPEQVRERVYYDPEIDVVVSWSGTLNQPAIHALYRSNFNAVDVFNRLALDQGECLPPSTPSQQTHGSSWHPLLSLSRMLSLPTQKEMA
jgi:hypothetical protein